MPGTNRTSHLIRASPGCTPYVTPPPITTAEFTVGIVVSTACFGNEGFNAAIAKMACAAATVALVVRVGDNPLWPCFPLITISKQEIPREIVKMDSQGSLTPLGSPTKMASVSIFTFSERYLAPCTEPASSSAVKISFKFPDLAVFDHSTAATNIAAKPPFMSDDPSP